MRRFLPLALLFAALPVALAQTSAACPRILAPISGRQMVSVRNSVPAIAKQSRFDVGMAPANTVLHHVRLVLARSAEQEAALKAYLAGEMNPSSPDYHKWLTPEEFGDRFGLDQADVDTLVSWLQSRGFTVRPVPLGRTAIEFSGSVANIEGTFGVHMHSFKHDALSFVSNVDTPQIPAALAPAIRAIAGLNTLAPQPLGIRQSAARYVATKHRFVPEYSPVGLTELDVAPADAATIYNTPNPFNANFPSSATSYTGKGVTIGIIGVAPITMVPIENFRNLFLGDSNLPTVVNPGNISGPDTSTFSEEAYMDVELAGGLAPGASIVYYEASDIWTAIQDALNDNKADILSLSFGDCTEDDQEDTELFQQAAAQGIAVVVGAADTGSSNTCSSGSDSTGLSVNAMTSTAYDVSVGGSMFYALANDFNQYVSATSGTFFRSALGYIPESVWNLTTSVNTSISDNDSNGADAGGDYGATGGGVQPNVVKPSWQAGPGVPADGHRDIPDVSVLSEGPYSGWIVCNDSTPLGAPSGVIGNCAPDGKNGFPIFIDGGTSASAPAFAGILALVEEKTGSRLGVADEQIYALANSSLAGEVFHDITVGNNSVPCVEGSPDCIEATPGNFFLSGYNAGPGYDLASGWGSVDATNLIKDWGEGPGSNPSLLSAVISSSVATGSPVENDEPITFKVTVAASATGDPVPTGTVSLSAGSYSSGATTLESTGVASITIPANTFQEGNVFIQIEYSGDGSYNPSSTSASITVSADPGVRLTATTPAAVTAGFEASSDLSVIADNGYAGTLTFNCTLTSSPSGATSVPTCSIPSGPISVISGVTTTETATFSTTASTTAANQPLSGPWEKTGMGGAALAGVLLFWIPGRKRAWRNLMCVLVAVCAVGLMTACSNAGNSPLPNKPAPTAGTTPGTYTFTIGVTGNPALKVAPITTVAVAVN